MFKVAVSIKDNEVVMALSSQQKGEDGRKKYRLWNLNADRNHAIRFIMKGNPSFQFPAEKIIDKLFSDMAEDKEWYVLSAGMDEQMLDKPTISNCIESMLAFGSFDAVFNRKTDAIELLTLRRQY